MCEAPHAPMHSLDLLAQPIYNEIKCKPSRFSADDSCIGCGKCARNCPHSCSFVAIQYGKHTKPHSQSAKRMEKFRRGRK